MQIEVLRLVRSGSRINKKLGESELGVESWAYKKTYLPERTSYLIFDRLGKR
jgi:hypothetical protein